MLSPALEDLHARHGAISLQPRSSNHRRNGGLAGQRIDIDGISQYEDVSPLFFEVPDGGQTGV